MRYFKYTKALGVRALSLLLVVLFVSHYANATLFFHTHTIEGITVVHSHFHNTNHGTTRDDGGHNRANLTLISIITKIQTTGVEIFNSVDEAEVIQIAEVLSKYQTPHLRSALAEQISLRAPPVL